MTQMSAATINETYEKVPVEKFQNGYIALRVHVYFAVALGRDHVFMTYKRKKYHLNDKHLKKRWRTKRRKKDLDEIDEDLKEENAEKLLKQEVDFDKPGSAQFYCLHCARYFIDNQALTDHFRTKVHKRRLKALELEPYTVEESERAAGKGSFQLPKKRKIETQAEQPVSKESVHDDGDVDM
ncbi:zinc finger protein 593 [Bacillus rossius redtenbacheri]|uniref:zinc finger protein 593 n=1 Tax=Bacillus rossius redtenbacheri TaxID=93214 RepID=UPI002FDCC4AC